MKITISSAPYKPKPAVGDRKLIRGIEHVRILDVVKYGPYRGAQRVSNGRPWYEWIPLDEAPKYLQDKPGRKVGRWPCLPTGPTKECKMKDFTNLMQAATYSKPEPQPEISFEKIKAAIDEIEKIKKLFPNPFILIMQANHARPEDGYRMILHRSVKDSLGEGWHLQIPDCVCFSSDMLKAGDAIFMRTSEKFDKEGGRIGYSFGL